LLPFFEPAARFMSVTPPDLPFVFAGIADASRFASD
jgi:hypothetical protein